MSSHPRCTDLGVCRYGCNTRSSSARIENPRAACWEEEEEDIPDRSLGGTLENDLETGEIPLCRREATRPHPSGLVGITHARPL